MNTPKVRKYQPFFLHLLGWSFLGLFLMWQPLSWQMQLPTTFWIKQAVLVTMLITIFYLNVYVWFPRYLARNRYFRFILLNIASVVLLAVIIEQVQIAIKHRESMDRAWQTARETNGRKKPKDKLDYFALSSLESVPVWLLYKTCSVTSSTDRIWNRKRLTRNCPF
jgi:two-component system LytT family sensor kinase